MLECRDLRVLYGHHLALDGVSLKVSPGEIVTILGANGAGKSTFLNSIAGIVDYEKESVITFNDKSITNLPSHKIVEAGLSLVPEGRDLFGDLTVMENLMLGAFPNRARSNQVRNRERVLEVFPKLAERQKQIARTMSGGEQQMVAVGRAMMSAPEILMLDEPSLGLSPILCTELFKALENIRQTGVGILLVEQNAKQSLGIADRGYLLETGRITGEDSAEALSSDPAVLRAYLGAAKAVVKKIHKRRSTDEILQEDIRSLISRAENRQRDLLAREKRPPKNRGEE